VSRQDGRRDAALRSSETTLKPSRPGSMTSRTRQLNVPSSAARRAPVPGVRFGHAVAFLPEALTQEAAEIAIILDEQYLHGENLRSSRAAGNVSKMRKSSKKTLPTSLGTSVLTHSANEHCTPVSAEPDCSGGYRPFAGGCFWTDGARLR